MNKQPDLPDGGLSRHPDWPLDKCVEWGIEMAELGYDSPHQFMLAGIAKPINYSECAAYLKTALKELGFPEKNGEDASISCCIYYAHEIAEERKVRENIDSIYSLLFGEISSRSQELFDDFFRLHWEWDELDCGNAHAYFWPGATLYNIESIAVQVAKEWTIVNRELCKLT